MSCYTLIKILIKNKAMAELALKKLNVQGTVVKNGDQFEINLKGQITQQFKDKFLQEYGVQVAIAKAKQEGYSVSRNYNAETNEEELVLRQYT